MLVGDDTQMIAFLRQALDREQEILAARAIDPARAQYQVCDAGRLHGLFAGQFAAAVDAQRIGDIVFSVSAGLCAVEHVIGRIVDHGRAEPRCFLRHHARCFAVDAHGQFRLLFGLVDGRVSGRIDDHGRFQGTDHIADLVKVAQIHGAAVKRDDVAKALQAAREFIADLAAGAGEQDLHANSSASASRLPVKSLADSSGVPVTGQSMPMAGSSQRMQRSCSGAQ